MLNTQPYDPKRITCSRCKNTYSLIVPKDKYDTDLYEVYYPTTKITEVLCENCLPVFNRLAVTPTKHTTKQSPLELREFLIRLMTNSKEIKSIAQVGSKNDLVSTWKISTHENSIELKDMLVSLGYDKVFIETQETEFCIIKEPYLLGLDVDAPNLDNTLS